MNKEKLQLLTATEASEILRGPVRSIYELVKQGRLTAIKERRRLKFRLKDIEAYIETHEYRALPLNLDCRK